MTQFQALDALKAEHALLATELLSDDTLAIILGQFATMDEDGVTTYDVTGAAIKALTSLIGTIPVSKSIGGISVTNESLTAAIRMLQRGRCGSIDLVRAVPEELEEL